MNVCMANPLDQINYAAFLANTVAHIARHFGLLVSVGHHNSYTTKAGLRGGYSRDLDKLPSSRQKWNWRSRFKNEVDY